ncbi:COMM domain containing 10 protein valette isoform X2 [Rhynchophorus ferrugineus]|uniref:COMM domain containing 10 protein valette isoform X2 n=1 Tax=Rhynchophorus ferrugineus TaxID=354439 RepID=UPI003FCD6ED3
MDNVKSKCHICFRLQQGISLINNINNKRFELLLPHILNSESADIFSDEELKKLQETLKLNEMELQLMLQSISYLFKHSNKVILKPTDLQMQLIQHLGIDETKAEIFVKHWSNEVKKDMGGLENRYNFSNIAWQVNVQTACDISNQQAIPNARIQLNLSKANEGTDEKVIMEMGEEDLHQLYNTLEVIQLKLDNMLKQKK